MSSQRYLSFPGGLAMSPHGNKVAYHLRTRISSPHIDEHEQRPPRYASNIWVANVGEADSARQVTHGSFNDHEPQWSADGVLLLFKSDQHPREHLYDPQTKYHLYRLWFGVDAEPVPILIPWPFTQFCPFPKYNRFLLTTQYVHTSFNQRFVDAHRLRRQQYSDCAIYGQGCVKKMSPCCAPDDGRVAMLVEYPVSEYAESTFPPQNSQLWIGGVGQPRPIAVSKTQNPRTPFSFSTSHLAWAGKTLYFLSKECSDVDKDGMRSKPAIYCIGQDPTREQEEEKDRDETYSKVYSGPDGDNNCRILGITGAGDDLLVHERDAAGDETLHLLHAGYLLWKQKEAMSEVVAFKPQDASQSINVAILTSPVAEDQSSEVFSIGGTKDVDAFKTGSLVQLSNHGWQNTSFEGSSHSTSLPYRGR